ncbi:MAG: monovalent cation/H+ antiporter complex subunit F [Ignavibacteria bacterium]|nr:monovalent cation/H+ antiporter complex subunit F [Ignavibacteria bacterium]
MIFNITQNIVLPILSISFLLVFIRLIRGPSLPDRVVAMDMLAVIIIGIIFSYSILVNPELQSFFIDVAMVIALLGFLGTVAFSYYFIKREEND